MSTNRREALHKIIIELSEQYPLVVPLEKVWELANYSESLFLEDLVYLSLTQKIELRTTSSVWAQNFGVRVFNIRGITYGFLKVV